jgi:hypothetical protein
MRVTTSVSPARMKSSSHIVFMSRFLLGTPYPSLVADVERLLEELPEIPGTGGDPALWLDSSGVGRGIADMFEEAGCAPHGVTIVGGNEVTNNGRRDMRIPKTRLIGNLQLALQTYRIAVSSDILVLPTWISEMENFLMRVSNSGAATREAFSEQVHDDLVVAAAIACWAADNPARRATNRFI